MDTPRLRKQMPVSALFDPKIVVPAIGSAFVKLDPRTLMKNPVMFVLEVVTALTTIILSRDVVTGKLVAPFCGPTRTEDDFLAHAQAVVETSPQFTRWHCVCDNLNIHQSEALVRWVADLEGIEQETLG